MIKYPTAFYRHPPAQFDGVFELWDLLDDAWSDGAQLSDIDAVIERGGHFLGFETKAPGVAIANGQQRTIDALVRDDRWTVIHCAKRIDDVRDFRVQARSRDFIVKGTAADLRECCRRWWVAATLNRHTR